MVKTFQEILQIAKERKTEQLPNLTRRELDILFSHLNRIRYTLEEQEEFIRFFMAVHSAIRER